MRTLSLFLLSTLLIVFTQTGFSQALKQETFAVAGECSMCQKKIEKAALQAGASYAEWNADTKALTVQYNDKSSTTARIQENIAKAGYDTPGFKASSEAYSQLEDCCKYDRNTAVNCCAGEDCCKEELCCTGGSCAKDTNCCTDQECKKECCHQS